MRAMMKIQGKTMSRRAVAALACVALALGGGAAVASDQWRTGAVDGADTLVSGCVIRFSSPDGTPTIHANGAHLCAGVESVGIDPAGNLRVVQTVTDPQVHAILFALCQTDETLGGARGITCGATGGTDDTSFVLYDSRLGRSLDLNDRRDRMRLQGQWSNLWVGWVHVRH